MARGTSSEEVASTTSAIDVVNLANPITRHVDVLRYATVGLGAPGPIAIEAAGFVLFTAAVFGGALWALHHQE